jgi:predicted RNase H-like HicB family nuclease
MKKTVLEYWRLVKLAFWCVFNVREADRYFREHTDFQRQLNASIDALEALSQDNAELKSTLYIWENGLSEELKKPLDLPTVKDSDEELKKPSDYPNIIKVADETSTITWDPADNIFVARALYIDGCMTHGKTFAEAKTALEEAIDLFKQTEKVSEKRKTSKTKKKVSKKKANK